MSPVTNGQCIDELVVRRDYVLDTLQSIALHFINLYSSTDQQCKLGYANSRVCDLYQLGEILKFFKKNKDGYYDH